MALEESQELVGFLRLAVNLGSGPTAPPKGSHICILESETPERLACMLLALPELLVLTSPAVIPVGLVEW